MASRSICVVANRKISFFFYGWIVFELEKAVAPNSSTLARKIPWTEEPGRLQPMGSRRVGHDWSDSAAAAAVFEYIKHSIFIPHPLMDTKVASTSWVLQIMLHWIQGWYIYFLKNVLHFSTQKWCWAGSCGGPRHKVFLCPPLLWL